MQPLPLGLMQSQDGMPPPHGLPLPHADIHPPRGLPPCLMQARHHHMGSRALPLEQPLPHRYPALRFPDDQL